MPFTDENHVFICLQRVSEKTFHIQNFTEGKSKNSALNIIDGVSRTSCMSTGTCNIMKIMGKEWHYASALLHSI